MNNSGFSWKNQAHTSRLSYYIREKVQRRVILPSYIKSSDQVANIFAKATSQRMSKDMHVNMGLLDLHQPAILKGNVKPRGVKLSL